MSAASPVLTVDVEDWFHVCGHPVYSDPSSWDGFAKRVHVGTGRLLDLLASSGATATFFCLGWIARKSPSLVRRIAEAGHDVGCHGDLHRRVYEMSREEFRSDLVRARDTLAEILGREVVLFRAPEWSMRSASNPAFEILAEEGFRLDSSLSNARPIGDRANPTSPAWIETKAGEILEVPPLPGTFFGRPASFGGGVCARLTRESRISAAIERSAAAGVPPVLYCHPWELDPEHPRMPGLGPILSLVKFAGRRRTEPRLARWLARHRFQPLSAVLAAHESVRSRAREAREVRPPEPRADAAA